MTSNPEAPAGQPSIALAHRYDLIRDLLANLLQGAGFSIAGQTDSVASLRRLLAQQSPDIVFLDWDLPDKEEDTIRTLVQEAPGRAVVIISGPQSSETFLGALQAGARGCLSYNLTSEDFIGRLRMLASGDLLISGDIVEGLQEQLAATESPDTQDGLSYREREVLALVAHGATNREIAEQLTVTENTIKVHLRHVLEKLDLRNRQQAVAYAVRSGLAEESSSGEAQQSGG